MSLKLLFAGTGIIVLSSTLNAATPPAQRHRQFAPGTWQRLEELPASRVRTRLSQLPAPARERAVAWLKSFHFTSSDLNSLAVDNEGGVFYADHFDLPSTLSPPAPSAEPPLAQAAVPVAPLADSLVFHSRPGAPNVLYLNFSGETVSGTAWNNSSGQSLFTALAFSTDGDYATFSDAEQSAIKRIWQRVAEDFAPFEIDVTTERPAVFHNRTAHVLITRSTGADGNPNPYSGSGGVGYVGVFGLSNYSYYRPVWIYANNLANSESNIAEAASHEVGHNLGLSHDGNTDGTEYYSGHGCGSTSWGPIMGGSYNRHVTQWSKGEYYLANNTQDDLATIASRLTYRGDDHGDSFATASPLILGGTNVTSTTPEGDPSNVYRSNKGTLQRNNDVDVFFFESGNGPIQLTVNPWIMPAGTRGGNLDVSLELYDAAGTLLYTNNPLTQTSAQIQTWLAQGTYYLTIRNTGVGDPSSVTPSGYTAYGSIGQYFISGYVAPISAASIPVELVATANHWEWGTVEPPFAIYEPGSLARITAKPAPYYRFLGWTNGITGTNNPLTLVAGTNITIEAVFGEILTANHSVPHAWLVANGYYDQFESATDSLGENGLPLWQSYVAGLNPNDVHSQLRLTLAKSADGSLDTLLWDTAPDRLYTLWHSTRANGPFSPVPGAIDLDSSTRSFSQGRPGPAAFYRVSVRKP